MTELTTTHVLGRHVDLQWRDRLLYRYVYESEVDQVESPRPYFHPLCTLGGETVTIFRPHDHKWHHGLSMTSAHLSGENFWGGATFVEGRGYAQLPNNGRIVHEAWDRCESLTEERLAWITQGGERWLEESRTIEVAQVDESSGFWTLRLGFELRNVSGRELEFGSPTTAGRPMAGYGGLFWRGPRSFLGGTVLADGVPDGADAMGLHAPWLAFVGHHDGSGSPSTIVFVDHPENPRYPNQWFVRSDPYGCVSFAFMFDEVYRLPAGERLAQQYRVIIADGAWSRERIATCADVR